VNKKGNTLKNATKIVLKEPVNKPISLAQVVLVILSATTFVACAMVLIFLVVMYDAMVLR
jgi:hypothetical protein